MFCLINIMYGKYIKNSILVKNIIDLIFCERIYNYEFLICVFIIYNNENMGRIFIMYVFWGVNMCFKSV